MKLDAPGLPLALASSQDLAALAGESRESGRDITALRIHDVLLTGEDFSKIEFAQCTFENCRLLGCNFHRASFHRCVFQNCDFSNSSVDSAFFNRCEFSSVKAVGLNAKESVWKNTRITESNLRYAAFDAALLERVALHACDCSETFFIESKLRWLELVDVRFSKASFFSTPLKGLDFTRCQIDGILVSQEAKELQGATVDFVQAADLAKLLGVIVR